jgi:multicomponent Na+:H+ antiporter subunit C
MIVLTATAYGVLVGCGIFLLVERDPIRVVAGTILLSNAAILFILASGFGRREEPIAPLAAHERLADPLVQAIGLTAAVIGFGITAFLLQLVLGATRALERASAGEQEPEAAEERR